MAIVSYPHTSNLVEGVPDRAVSAEFLRRFYQKDRGDGILLLGDSSACQVVATSPTSRYVNVKPGYAFIQGAYAINDENISLHIDNADFTLNRYDTIVLRLDETANYRSIDAYVLKGTPAATPSVPELTRNQEIYEIGIANIYVPAASSTVQQQHIFDTRLNIERCGESVPLQPIDTTRFFDQMQDLWNREKELVEHAIDETMAGYLDNKINDLLSNKLYGKGHFFFSLNAANPLVDDGPWNWIPGSVWTKLENVYLFATTGSTGYGGSNTIVLTESQMPKHYHAVSTKNTPDFSDNESAKTVGTPYLGRAAYNAVFEATGTKLLTNYRGQNSNISIQPRMFKFFVYYREED